MTIKPIIPIWIITIICLAIIFMKRKRIAAYIRQIIIAILVFVINIGIFVPNGTTEAKVAKIDAYVVFAVDTTISMLAQDYDGNSERLTAVKNDCDYIMNELIGAKFAVISFDNHANLLAPFSDNISHVNNVFASICSLDTMYARGTSMDACEEFLNEFLKRTQKDKKNNLILFFISDGEITKDDASLCSFSRLSEYVNGGAVLGYGTEKGGQMYSKEVMSENRELVTYYDNDYNRVPAISKIDESNLKKIAGDIGIQYIHMTDSKNVDSILNNIKKSVASIKETEDLNDYRNISIYFAIPLVILLVYEFISVHIRHDERV